MRIRRFLLPAGVTALLFGCLSPGELPGMALAWYALIGGSCGSFAAVCFYTWWNR